MVSESSVMVALPLVEEACGKRASSHDSRKEVEKGNRGRGL
jgi:hypothetical protein